MFRLLHLQCLVADAVKVAQNLQADATLPQASRGRRKDRLARAAPQVVKRTLLCFFFNVFLGGNRRFQFIFRVTIECNVTSRRFL